MPVKNKARLVCKVDLGQPPAKVTWFKEGREIKDAKKYKTSLKDGEAVLEVPQVELSDGATYKVEVDNKVEKVECEAKIIVLGWCGFLESYCLDMISNLYRILSNK